MYEGMSMQDFTLLCSHTYISKSPSQQQQQQGEGDLLTDSASHTQ